MGCVNGKPILGKEDLEFIATYTGKLFQNSNVAENWHK